MSVKMEASAGKLSENTLMIYGIVVALVGTYLTYLNAVTGIAVFSFFGGIGAIAALWWGSDTIKHLCSYGLGTGVPSAGMVAFGAGAIAMIAGTKFGLASPIVTLVLAAIIGAVIGYCANNIINMNIPVMIFSSGVNSINSSRCFLKAGFSFSLQLMISSRSAASVIKMALLFLIK